MQIGIVFLWANIVVNPAKDLNKRIGWNEAEDLRENIHIYAVLCEILINVDIA
jgi:hypothetical protein